MALNRELRGERTPPSPPLLLSQLPPVLPPQPKPFGGLRALKLQQHSGLGGKLIIHLNHLQNDFSAPQTLRLKLCKLAETRGSHVTPSSSSGPPRAGERECLEHQTSSKDIIMEASFQAAWQQTLLHPGVCAMNMPKSEQFLGRW